MEFFLGAFQSEWESRKAALLHERSLGRNAGLDEEERRRRGGVVPVAGERGRNSFRSERATRASARGNDRRGSTEPTMRSRFAALASGSQPAVVKVASFGGGGRLGAMINYVSRNGDVTVENERGEKLHGRDELSAVRREWDHLMKNRVESRDIGTFIVEVKEPFEPAVDIHEQARVLLRRALGDRRFAFAVRAQGEGYGIEGIAVLRDSRGERLTADRKASEIVEDRLGIEGSEQELTVSFRFTGYGNGTDYGTSRLRDLLVRQPGAVQDEQGRAIGDTKQAGELVKQEWRDQLHSRKPRDVMHIIMSARPGTDVRAFQEAARDFLAREFAGHRYVFSLHDPLHDPKAEEVGGKRPHVHVHAIVAMRSDVGDRVETTIPAFRRWRVTMAEKAREYGIRMEMTDRRERASAPAYTRSQVRPTSRRGRTEHEGTSEAAQRRYEAKRSDQQSSAGTERSRDYTHRARKQWQTIVRKEEDRAVSSFASDQINRLKSDDFRETSDTAGVSNDEKLRSQFMTHLVTLKKIVSEDKQMRHMNRSEFEAYEKSVETALFRAERAMSNEERANFEEIAVAAREHVNVRRELMELSEQRTQGERDGAASQRDRDDDPRARWNDAVERHGMRTVEAANQIMLEVERYREEIERADAREIKIDKASLQANLDRELIRAGELGAAGNTLIREIAEVDEELKIAIESAEQSREHGAKLSADGSGSAAPQLHSNDDVHRDRGSDVSDARHRSEAEVRLVEPDERRQATAVARSRDTTRTDPAQQHVPRLEQLQREVDERRERDQDDREQ